MNISKKSAGLIAILGLAAGSAATLGLQTHAQTSSTSGSTGSIVQRQFDPSKAGHIGRNGFKEELLTGDMASKVTAAAMAAQPGATIQRVETDAEGAAYEAHIIKADGTMATLKFDSNFNVTATETGFRGGHGPRGSTQTSIN
jgi:hypothetical protein